MSTCKKNETQQTAKEISSALFVLSRLFLLPYMGVGALCSYCTDVVVVCNTPLSFYECGIDAAMPCELASQFNFNSHKINAECYSFFFLAIR